MLQNAAGFYIDRLHVDGVEQKDFKVTVEPDHVPKLSVQLSPEAGKVQGVVREEGKPVPGALVVIVSRSGQINGFPSIGYQTDSDGSFRFDHLPPGDYVLITSGDMELEYANPAVIQPLESAGVAIATTKGSTLVKDLELNSR